MFEKLLKALNSEKPDAPLHFRAHGENMKPADLPEYPAVACLTHDTDSFRACVLMRTANPSSKATQDNQPTWELGDAAELFIQLAGHEDYWEFHSTPVGIRLQLHLPGEFKRFNMPFEQQKCDIGLKLVNKIIPEQKLWYTELIIPFAGIGATSPECKFFFGRYNYSDFPEGEKELSSWPFVKGTFHCPGSWDSYK